LRKKSLTIYLFLLICFLGFYKDLKADEGMWLPLYTKDLNDKAMKKMGSKMSADDIYSINNSSFKDAVVSLAGGNCTAELVSEEGLLFTNHHCAFEYIASHSTSAKDYLKNGFWAKNKGEEIPNPGLTASILVSMTDYTPIFQKRLEKVTNEEIRQIRIDILSDSLVKDAIKGTNYEGEIKSFYDGTEFYLMIYEVFKDVRLVGNPPQSIGKFGGDVDNWMWPRHTGDFAILRIYADENNRPAPNSPYNKPYKPKKFFKLSLDGVKQDHFTMIMGFPGYTRRYLSSDDLEFALRYTNPAAIEALELQIKIVEKSIQNNRNKAINLGSSYSNLGNAYKYYYGQQRQLANKQIINRFWENEDDFKSWINANEENKIRHGKIIQEINTANQKLKVYKPVITYLEMGILSSRFAFSYINQYVNLVNALPQGSKTLVDRKFYDSTIKIAYKGITKYLSDSTLETDYSIVKEEIKLAYRRLPVGLRNDFAESVFATPMVPGTDFEGQMDRYLDGLKRKSIIMRADKIKKFFTAPDIKASVIYNDPVFNLMGNLYNFYKQVQGITTLSENALTTAHRNYLLAYKEFKKGKLIYPDANSTLRITYGRVRSYYPMDGKYYKYYSTADGILQKSDTVGTDFRIDSTLTRLLKKREFGKYGQDDTLRVCFLTNNDITGGNSGSPVVNKNGQMVGIAFDGNWESMIGDLFVEPNLSRTIVLDIRYVLWVIDYYAKSKYLIDELNVPPKTSSIERF